ncbi:MAG TPA: sulfurtransferase TusA family protein [Actinomycetota bacterium]|jgi:tRNA 2-thiouridine synthesizing protein A|nr:sulfurtransferase TusA family protein [Actinomycetota bacterium]
MSTTIITVDAKGQSCPGPLVSLAKAIKEAPQGAAFELLATDPGSKSDVPSWAELTGNVVESAETLADGSFRYLISRAV